jgi:hypothetical protein
MATSILQQLTTTAVNLLQKPAVSNSKEVPNNISSQNLPTAGSNQIAVPREVVQNLSQANNTPTASQTETKATITPKEISDAKLSTQELNPKFLKKIAADLQPTLLKATGSKEEQITQLTNLITDVLAGKDPAIPEFKHEKVLDFSRKKPAESFLERVIARYHTEATSKDTYPKNLDREELTKLIKDNLEPLVGLAIKLDNANLTNQISNLFNRNLDITSGHNNSFFGGFVRNNNNNLEKAVRTASDDLFTQLATSKPELVLRSMLDKPSRGGLFDSSSGTASALLAVSDEGFKTILVSLKSQPDSLVAALASISSKEINHLVGYGAEDLTKGRQDRLSQILEAVTSLETKLTDPTAVAEFSKNKMQVVKYLTRVVNPGSR